MAVRTNSLTVRIDPKVKYLAAIAARARGCTLTSHLESALEDSFKRVTLRVPPEPEPMYGDGGGNWTMPKPPSEEEERAANDAMSIANLGDKLWKENEFQRLQSLEILAPHILPQEDHALLKYLHSRDDLKTHLKGGYKLNREKIIKEWKAIRKDFRAQKQLKETERTK